MGAATPVTDALAHPAFAPFRHRLIAGAWPNLALLNGWARDQSLSLPNGRTLKFVAATADGALAYETAVARDGAIGVRRGSLHDVLNALVWLTFPRTKAALNERHVHDGASATPNKRSRARDAATLLDESGLLMVCADVGLVQLLREHAWRELFLDQRDAVARAMRPLVVGHGLLTKLVAPFRAITARTLIVPIAAAERSESAAGTAAIDILAAAAIADPAFAPEGLPPLPVVALPGWDWECLAERLFDDHNVFRPRRV